MRRSTSSSRVVRSSSPRCSARRAATSGGMCRRPEWTARSEEHTSELQSRLHIVCRLLLEKKKIIDSKCVLYFQTTFYLIHYFELILCHQYPLNINMQ